MTNNKINKLIILLFSVIAFQQLSAHPMGFAVSNLNYSKGTITFSTRIFYSDFYYEFEQTSKVKNRNYPKSGLNNEDKKELISYFKKNIKIWVDNNQLKFNTYSFKFEMHEEDVYVFIVEVQAETKIEKGSRIKITDTVLLNTIGGQKQIINVFLNGSETPSHGIITLDKDHPIYEFINE